MINKNETMSVEQLLKVIVKSCPNAILLDDLDECIVAVHIGLPNKTNVIYSKAKVIDRLVNRDGMTYSEAIEFFDFNILGLKFDVSIMPYFVEDSMFNISLN
jgi:hypothetical protein